MSLPVLSREEKKQALLKAQAMRKERKGVREKLKNGRLSLHDVLNSSNNQVFAKMRVAYLLASLPRVGKTTAKKLMDDIGIDDGRRVQGLGKRQREELLSRLAGK